MLGLYSERLTFCETQSLLDTYLLVLLDDNDIGGTVQADCGSSRGPTARGDRSKGAGGGRKEEACPTCHGLTTGIGGTSVQKGRGGKDLIERTGIDNDGMVVPSR